MAFQQKDRIVGTVILKNILKIVDNYGIIELMFYIDLTICKMLLHFILRRHAKKEDKMANVFDVASYILNDQGSMTTMKLQKLVYYSQAWALVWDSKALFNDRIEAWASGPVVPNLYDAHRGQFEIESLERGQPNKLEIYEKDTIDAVLKVYGGKSAQWLSDLSHMEKPWKDARKGRQPGENCRKEISHAATAEYYLSL